MMTLASTLGWFSRVVTVTVELDGPIVADEGEEFIIPWDSFTGLVASFDTEGNLSGRVKIVVGDGLKVWHTGLILNIEQYLHYLDPFVSSDLCAREMKIVVDPVDASEQAGCWLEGTVYVSFSIPLSGPCNQRDCYASYSPIISDSTDRNSPLQNLSQNVRTETAVGATFFVRDSVHSPATSGTCKIPSQIDGSSSNSSSSSVTGLGEDCLRAGIRDMCKWIPTYNGEAFGLKHSIMVTLCRPWYAHSPELCVPLKLYSTLQEDFTPVGADDQDDEDTGVDSYKNPRPMILTVVDVAGLCVMTIPSRWLDLDQPVLTKIELRDYSTSIVGLTLLVIRTEYIHDVHKDTVMFVHSVFGPVPEDLKEVIPADALHSSGYVTREDHNAAPQSAATSGPGQPSTHGKVDKPVDTGEGVCATFLFELPMGNASSLYNQALSSTASTAVPSSSSTTGWSSPMALKSPEGQGGGQGQVSPGRDHSPRPEGAEGNNSSSSGSSSSSSSSSSGRGIAKSLSYGQRAHRMQEDNEETYKRQSRLCPSFSTSQQEGTQFNLYVAHDSYDDNSSDEENEDKTEKGRSKGRAYTGTGDSDETGSDVSTVHLSSLSLNDPELGHRQDGDAGDEEEREADLADQYTRSQLRKQKIIEKNEVAKKKTKKPFFDFLDDSVGVRFFFRLVVQDVEGGIKWNTEEVVLFRSKPPHSSCHRPAAWARNRSMSGDSTPV